MSLKSARLVEIFSSIQGEGTHVGEDALAPYYSFSTVPYATSAVQVLLQDSTLDAETKKALEAVRDDLKISLLGQLKEDGLFETPGVSDYETAPTYVNPLKGLALIPLAESCKENVKSSELLGVLNQK